MHAMVLFVLFASAVFDLSVFELLVWTPLVVYVDSMIRRFDESHDDGSD